MKRIFAVVCTAAFMFTAAPQIASACGGSAKTAKKSTKKKTTKRVAKKKASKRKSSDKVAKR